MTEPTMANNMAEEPKKEPIPDGGRRLLDIKVGPPPPEYFEKEYREFINRHNDMVKYVYTEHALNKILKKDLIKDLIRLHEQNHILRKESLYPNTIKYIEIIEDLEAINKNHTKTRELIERQAERKLDKVEEEKRLLLLRVAELEEQLTNK